MSSPVPKGWEAGAGWGPWAVLLRQADGEYREVQSGPLGRLIAGWATVLAVAVQVGVALFVRRDITPIHGPDFVNLGLAVVAAGLACAWCTVAGLTVRVPPFLPLSGVLVGCVAAHIAFYFGTVPLIGEERGDPDSLLAAAQGGFLGGMVACIVGAVAAIMVAVPILWLLGLRESNQRVERLQLGRNGETEVREDQRLEETDDGGWNGRG